MTAFLITVFGGIFFLVGWVASSWYHTRPSKFDQWRKEQYDKMLDDDLQQQ